MLTSIVYMSKNFPIYSTLIKSRITYILSISGGEIMSDIAKTVGDRIRALRNERGWSQEELAHRADIHPSYMGQLERGEKSATIDSLVKVINAFEISFDEFFRFMNTEYRNKDTATLSNILYKLNNRKESDQKIILNLIDVLLPWKDEE